MAMSSPVSKELSVLLITILVTKRKPQLFSLILHDPWVFYFPTSLCHSFYLSFRLFLFLPLSPSPHIYILKHLLWIRLSVIKPEQNWPPSYCHGAYKSNWELRHSSNNPQIYNFKEHWVPCRKWEDPVRNLCGWTFHPERGSWRLHPGNSSWAEMGMMGNN